MTVELYPPQAAVAASTGDGAIDLGLLNGFELRQDGRIVRLPLSAQRLVAFLALHGRPLRRLYVAGTLWLDTSQDSANANLRTALWRLRRPGCILVDATPTELSLADGIAVDLHDASQRAHRVLSHDAQPHDVGELSEAGDLLPDWYDDWLIVDRERFRQLRLHALETLADDLAASGRFAAATDAALAALSGEPLRESAHRTLIRLHLAEGNAAEALRQYKVYCSLLRTALDLDPSPSMQALVSAVASRADGKRLL